MIIFQPAVTAVTQELLSKRASLEQNHLCG